MGWFFFFFFSSSGTAIVVFTVIVLCIRFRGGRGEENAHTTHPVCEAVSPGRAGIGDHRSHRPVPVDSGEATFLAAFPAQAQGARGRLFCGKCLIPSRL